MFLSKQARCLLRHLSTPSTGPSTNIEITTAFDKVVRLGASESITKCFSAAGVAIFAQISGDSNPLHVDAEYESKTRFKKPIVHGVLMNGVISGLMGASLPGPGSIFLSQEVRFKAPLYVGESVTAWATCLDKNNATLMHGTAKVMLEHPKGFK